MRAVADFDRHYMPNGAPDPDKSIRGIGDEYRSELKRNAKDISRSFSEVFTFLTHGTKSQAEAKVFLDMVTNVPSPPLF
jgi:hypothetical protein